MDTIFAFHVDKTIVCVNLYRVHIQAYAWGFTLTETGCDRPTSWDVTHGDDVAILQSWLVYNALNGELFKRSK